MNHRYRAEQREKVRAKCLERGISIEKRGLGYRLHGPGVEISVLDLSMLEPKDLKPYQPRKWEDRP